jgi:hypothetical protein
MPSLTPKEVDSYILQAKEKMVTEPIYFTHFIESGTYFGDTVANIQDKFQKVYTIDVSQSLYDKAKQRFQGNANVTCYHGDSATVMKNLLPLIQEPCIFWLDAHWSMGNTEFKDVHVPLYKELDVIVAEMKFPSLVIIDDVRLFGIQDHEVDWTPITIEKVLQKVQSKLLVHWFAPSSLHPQDRLLLLLK